MKQAAQMKGAALGITLALVACGAACGTVDRPDPGTSSAPTTSRVESGPDKLGEGHTEKPGAPVSVQAKLGPADAALDVVFDGDASDVTIDVWGTDGLVVTSAKTPITGRRFARGEKISLGVSFTAPTAPLTRADLAVRVRGTFDGRARERIRSFTVNPEAPSATPAPGDVRIGPDGQPVRVMKAQ